MNFKLTKLNGRNVIINDKNGIVNGASSFVKKISFSINGREVYQCNSANHVVNIKNLLEYNSSYAKTIGTNEFYYLDTTNSPNRNKYLTRHVQHGRNNANTGWTPRIFIENEDPTFNEGFDKRKKQLGKLTRCYLKANENVYPNIDYKPSTEPSRVYRDFVVSYGVARPPNGGGTLLNENNFESLFPFIYFKLPNLEHKVKLSFHYEIRGELNADYTIFAIVLHEKDLI